MVDHNLVLYVASYGDAASANEDFEALKSAESSGEMAVDGSVVLSRDADGKVKVDESLGEVKGGAAAGGVAGLVVGLFAPPLLLAGAVGAGIGAGIGELVKKHEEKKMGAQVEDFLPADSSAIVVVIDDKYLDRVDKALSKSAKKVNKAIDSGDYDKIQKAIADAGGDIGDAVES